MVRLILFKIYSIIELHPISFRYYVSSLRINTALITDLSITEVNQLGNVRSSIKLFAL